ncbi:MtN3-like protein [Plasmodium ovale]|uniref:Sugar transporter SWEET1 n=2 Tax=Plasmodium ovale TaxID=36330 RepID=A0A1A8VLX5_PLAOA|nr:MtN3-like protein [Plasmodium ovale curtisi]SBS81314.1 MtN3-like protein [Plasmodium ovale curtisi]SCN43057.1 MtN3-like protein [Plasmodium ovale]
MGIMKRLPLQIAVVLFLCCYSNIICEGVTSSTNVSKLEGQEKKNAEQAANLKGVPFKGDELEEAQKVLLSNEQAQKGEGSEKSEAGSNIQVGVKKVSTTQGVQKSASGNGSSVSGGYKTVFLQNSEQSSSKTNDGTKKKEGGETSKSTDGSKESTAETGSSKESTAATTAALEVGNSKDSKSSTTAGSVVDGNSKDSATTDGNLKDVEHSVVKEITPQKEEVKEDQNKKTNADGERSGENVSSSSKAINSTRSNESNGSSDSIGSTGNIGNTGSGGTPNEYIDLTSKKIYEEMKNQNEEQKSSDMYFLKVLSIGSSIFMQLILFPSIFKILKRKSTGELDGLPYVVLLFSSFLWLVYGILLNNSAIVFPNLVGLLLGIFYSIIYHTNCKNMWLKQKLFSYYKICGFVCFLLYAFLYVLTYEQYELFVGFIAFVSSIINFGAPLSYIQIVIKKRNSSLIPMEIAIGSLICSFLWLTYGFTLRDGFLIIPNLCGFILSLVQVALILLYTNKETLSYNDTEICYNDTEICYNDTEICYNEGNKKKMIIPENNLFFNEFNIQGGNNKRSEVSTNVNSSFFDLSYDETSPLTGNFREGYNQQNNHPNQKYLNRSPSGEESPALTF